MLYTTLLAGFAALAVAAPSSSKNTWSYKNYLATFDDLTATPGTPLLFPVGNYDGLTWTNFDVDNESLGLVGVAPKSQTNSAVFLGTQTGTLTANYAKSYVGSFSLKSFYFGCSFSYTACQSCARLTRIL